MKRRTSSISNSDELDKLKEFIKKLGDDDPLTREECTTKIFDLAGVP